MKKYLFALVMLTLGAAGMWAQEASYFTPYQKTRLRLPSVPLLVNDPYFSFWSPYNQLYGGTTRHWGDQQKAMDGLLRVDGQVYRFMGAKRDVVLEPIAPMGYKGGYTAKARMTALPSTQQDTWMNLDFTETGWGNSRGPWGQKAEYPTVQTAWTGDNKDIYIRRHVTLTADNLKDDLYLMYSHDDNFELYFNGVKLAEHMDAKEPKWRQNQKVKLNSAARATLVEGDNVIAFHVHNTSGGSLADVGLYRNKQGKHGGLKAIAAMADEGPWTAKTRTSPGTSKWMNEEVNETSWKDQQGAFGSPGEYPNVNTSWTAANSDIYIRRHVTLTEEDLQKSLWLIYSHDDVCEAYINGRQLVKTGETWVQNVKYQLTAEDMAVLHTGDNVIAYHVHNTTGGALADIGLYCDEACEAQATQNYCHVLATNTYYNFTCGPVTLDVVFTAPFLMDDVEKMSTPINYISYQVTSNDETEHDVQFYFGTTPEMVVDNNSQATVTTLISQDGVQYIKSGSKDQKILGRAGDNIAIDWGYLYLPAINGTLSVASAEEMASTFAATGKLPESATSSTSTDESEMPTLAFMNDLGKVTSARSYMMFGYDEIYDMRYMDKDYKGYWARNGKTIFTAFQEFREQYDDIMTRCQEQDKVIYDDGLKAASAKYAELLSASYRQCIAAHKIFEDNKGNLLFFSKENNSNGCVNTVDLTYPSAPLFLIYNTELMKGMCTSILDYCESDRWGFDFAAHDLGTYPHANNQVYSIRRPDANGGFAGNMPIEESGNIVILAAAISMVDGNMDWANRYWGTLTTWTEYLAENGLDPENQLCTDDFAGHLAHNANLSIKAIMGVAGYALMCKMRGEMESYDRYLARAQEMATAWVDLAKDSGTPEHYKLAFDKPGTWSQKYNMIWDNVWGLDLFPETVKTKEVAYYLTKLNTYGLPLDSRRTYTKSDWIAWSASLSKSLTQFNRFMDLLYKYVHETPTRVPLSDWFETTNGAWVSFRARSVIGGHWMKVLLEKVKAGELMNGIVDVPMEDKKEQPNIYFNEWYDLGGRRVEAPAQQGVYIHQGKKMLKK